MRFLDLPSQPLLIQLFEYSPETGILRYIDGVGTVRRSGGYWHVEVDGQSYLAHRIVWKMMTGDDPADLIDHIDTDGFNNKWENLREASGAQNIRNSKLSNASKTGIKGVTFDRVNKKWRASITVDFKAINLGRYDSIAEAAAVRAQAAEMLHGEFARH